MKAQKIETDYRVDAIEIGHLMIKSGLPKPFIVSAVETAFKFEGVYNLMKMWAEEDDKEEKDETIAEIQDLVEDCAQSGKSESVYVSRQTPTDLVFKEVLPESLSDIEGLLRQIKIRDAELSTLTAKVKRLEEVLIKIQDGGVPRGVQANAIERMLTMSGLARAALNQTSEGEK